MSDGLSHEDLFFGMMCAIKQFGKDDTIILNNARDVNEWIESLEDKTVQLSFTGMPDGQSVAITMLVGRSAIEEFKKMGFGKEPIGEG